MHLHAKMDQWQRDEEGHYRAEVSGWELVVKWQPEDAQGVRGFWFEARSPQGMEQRSPLFEEIEHAMARAELLAHEPPAAP